MEFSDSSSDDEFECFQVQEINRILRIAKSKFLNLSLQFQQLQQQNAKKPTADTATLRNVQTVISVFSEQGYLNKDGSVFPLLPENLCRYIDFQANRIENNQLSFSSLNWYLQSLRRYCIDTGMDWESVRGTDMVKTSMTRARKIASDVKKLKLEEKVLENQKEYKFLEYLKEATSNKPEIYTQFVNFMGNLNKAKQPNPQVIVKVSELLAEYPIVYKKFLETWIVDVSNPYENHIFENTLQDPQLYQKFYDLINSSNSSIIKRDKLNDLFKDVPELLFGADDYFIKNDSQVTIGDDELRVNGKVEISDETTPLINAQIKVSYNDTLITVPMNEDINAGHEKHFSRFLMVIFVSSLLFITTGIALLISSN